MHAHAQALTPTHEPQALRLSLASSEEDRAEEWRALKDLLESSEVDMHELHALRKKSAAEHAAAADAAVADQGRGGVAGGGVGGAGVERRVGRIVVLEKERVDMRGELRERERERERGRERGREKETEKERERDDSLSPSL